MSYQFPPDVDRLIREQMALGGFTSEDEVLRHALNILGQFACDPIAAADEYQQSVAAVRDGIADMEAGRMRSLRDVISEAPQNRSDENPPCDSRSG